MSISRLAERATVITYPDGAVVGDAVVTHVAEHEGRTAIFLDATPFHAVDQVWPDQPDDHGTMTVGDRSFPILGGAIAATDGESLLFGRDIPVRQGTEGWTFHVAHLLDTHAADVLAEGDAVTVTVDAERRANLSAAHTACHLVALALNAALDDAWRTPARRLDGLGHSDFDATAIQSSTIDELLSIDVYRLGKSLRKAGFDPAALEDLAGVTANVDAQLAAWIAQAPDVRIERDGTALTDRRLWVTTLDGQRVAIPCGGTHAHNLAALAAVTVAMQLDAAEGGSTLQVTTRVRL